MPPLADIAVVRPATALDVKSLVKIAKEVGIGHSQPKAVSEEIAFSRSLLQGEAAWNQGPLYLCSEAYSHDMAKRHGVVGQCKLEIMAAGVWKAEQRTRKFHAGKSKIEASYSYLEYESQPRNALEFAANAVMTAHRGKGLGSLHIRARMLLLRHLLPLMPHIKSLCSVTLTQEDIARSGVDKKTGDRLLHYPFYEHAVKPLFGGKDFGSVDTLRYQNRSEDGEIPFVNEFLARRSDKDPARVLATHLLPEAVRKSFGSVRTNTNRTHEFFLRLGFTHNGRYDVLDSSQVLEASRAQFDGIAEVDRYTAKEDRDIDPSLPHRVFMARVDANRDWSLADFRCVRAPVRELPGKVLAVDPRVLGLIRARDGDALDVLALANDVRQSSSRKTASETVRTAPKKKQITKKK